MMPEPRPLAVTRHVGYRKTADAVGPESSEAPPDRLPPGVVPLAKPLGEAMTRLAPADIEPLLSLDGLAEYLNCSRRMVERLKSAGKLPRPDLRIGRMPRWKPETVRRWIDDQARGRGGTR